MSYHYNFKDVLGRSERIPWRGVTNVKVAAALEFAVAMGAILLASQLLWLIAAPAVGPLA